MRWKGLPETWESRALGEVADITMGQSPPGSSYNQISDGCPFLQGNAEFGVESPTPSYWTTEPRKMARKGSVLFSVRAPIGAVNIANTDYCIGRGLSSVSLHRGDNKYLYYLLRYLKPSIEQKGTGSTFKSITKTTLEDLVVPLPPLDTQRKIVAILDKAEATQRLRADADALMQQLLQSVYVSVFGDPVSNPQGWDIVNLESVCKKITDGEHVTPRRSQSGIYLLSARNIKDHEIELSDVDYIDQEEYDRISRRIIPRKGDVLISCSGSVGRVSQITDDIKFQMVRSVALIRPDNQKLDSTYLEYTFDTNYLKTQIAQSVNQSSQANLFQNKIRELRIPIPPMHLQEVFADIAERKERIAENQKINSIKAQELYNSLLSKAFTGDLVA